MPQCRQASFKLRGRSRIPSLMMGRDPKATACQQERKHFHYCLWLPGLISKPPDCRGRLAGGGAGPAPDHRGRPGLGSRVHLGSRC